MTIEFLAICPEKPDAPEMARTVEVLLGSLLGAAAPVSVQVSDGDAVMRLGDSAEVLVLTLAPGSSEFADSWVVTVAVGKRNESSWLLAVVAAVVAAVLTGGRFWDEAGLLSPGLDARGVLAAAVEVSPASPAVILGALQLGP